MRYSHVGMAEQGSSQSSGASGFVSQPLLFRPPNSLDSPTTSSTPASTLDDSTELDDERGDSEEPAAMDDSERPLPKRPKYREKRTFNEEWKVKYLVWPNQHPGEAENEVSEMICILCQERMKAKSSTAVRHLERKHASSKSLSMDKKQRLVKQFECVFSRQIKSLSTALLPD